MRYYSTALCLIRARQYASDGSTRDHDARTRPTRPASLGPISPRSWTGRKASVAALAGIVILLLIVAMPGTAAVAALLAFLAVVTVATQRLANVQQTDGRQGATTPHKQSRDAEPVRGER